MGRQRTIDDGTWRSMRMSGRTVEDRYALLYLLTSPFSNVVGVYELVIPIAAPEMGWDAESQLKPVLQRLTDAGFLEYDPETGFIWVCDWWLHNSARMAAGPALLKKTIDQIRQMPNQWRDVYLADFMPRLAQDSKEYGAISREFGYQNAEISPPLVTLSTGCRHPVQTLPTGQPVTLTLTISIKLLLPLQQKLSTARKFQNYRKPKKFP